MAWTPARLAHRYHRLIWLLCLGLMGCAAQASYKSAGAPMREAAAPGAPPMPESAPAGTATAGGGYGSPGASSGVGYEFDADKSAPPAPPRSAQNDASKEQPTTGSPSTSPPSQSPPRTATDAPSIQQLLVYTASLRVSVQQVDPSLTAIEDMARRMGGYLASRNDRTVTIRVPTERFQEALRQISAMGEVMERQVSVEDVTEQFMDAALRLQNARQVRDRIQQLLANAKTVEEALAVERELRRLNAEIELLEGRLKYLRELIRYSTLTVTLEPRGSQEHLPGPLPALPFPWLSELGLGRLTDLH